ncbi:PREDICTED: LIM and senescent cell antigen-like-containing domain protein 1 isoform X2 [Amphimedon queenslandica]|uniref:LIM zinc-binding domain-containing protein n=1 Tax=Amphimedon queenslandica TaxID=400682 RepID=A0AAN0JGH6_AMPQE|nr:PREDICTED: LIM and senescent cell antigen-like-containing domain protein 1 isoform X2 [Amphimedon queenslandica]|eukprot:XP_019855906.1 PREDICTED: LIM and senescent cell antigen-like-containing domain protein 1 isoform X2 [Amphimedon queenslandica]
MDFGGYCNLCQDPFEPTDGMVNAGGHVWHETCFVCVQCFQPFPEGVFFEHEGRRYCEQDYKTLYAPCCSGCGDFVIGRVIRAVSQSWHPKCFKCVNCHCELADIGFVKNQGRPLCKRCNSEFKGGAKKFCAKCSKQLTARCREKDGDLYCLRCFDNMESSICGACRRPIEGRVIHAVGRTWHPEHFVCSYCEQPFEGRRHYERKGLAYCERDYQTLYGDTCFGCNKPCKGDVVTVLNKSWCIEHFNCTACDTLLSSRGGAKYIDMDERPYCKKCFDKIPVELRRRLKKQAD